MLGILLMNAVYFGLGSAPYFNLSAGPSQTPLDWAIGILGEVFVDQKFMMPNATSKFRRLDSNV